MQHSRFSGDEARGKLSAASHSERREGNSISGQRSDLWQQSLSLTRANSHSRKTRGTKNQHELATLTTHGREKKGQTNMERRGLFPGKV